MRQNIGFTLLEIIIVVIIVGVLASLALPKLYSTIELSKSVEALSHMSLVRKDIERCIAFNPCSGVFQCTGLCGLIGVNENKFLMENPTGMNGSLGLFTYGSLVYSNQHYMIQAVRTTVDGGDGTSQIFLVKDSASVTKYGTGSFAGL